MERKDTKENTTAGYCIGIDTYVYLGCDNNMFDDIKVHDGRVYSGVRIGGTHEWNYVNAIWEETKLLADKWQIRFTAAKQRRVAAPEGSGAPLGTAYHWYILADQVVKKTTANEYTTEMTGMKFKLGHKRPYWKGFSYTYHDQPTYRQKLIRVLKETLGELEEQEAEEQEGTCVQKRTSPTANCAAVW